MFSNRYMKLKKSKNKVAAFLAVVMAVSFSGVAYASGTPVRVVVDGVKYPIEETTPFTEGGTTWVPLRFVSEKMGAKLNWDPKTNLILISKGDVNISLTVGSSSAQVNGETVTLDAAVMQKQGITMVPLRFISEQLHAEVSWLPSLGTVNIVMPDKEPGETDPYGRKIRTTNLPKNYQEFPYILEDIPNEMYEMKIGIPSDTKNIGFSDAFGYTPPAKLLKTNPEFTKENIDIWMDHIVKFGDLSLNINYRTMDNQKWVDDMLAHILEQSKGSVSRKLRNYAAWVKENQIIIEGHIEPEPSMIFFDNWGVYCVRSKIKFKFTSFNESRDLLYNADDRGKFKKNVWYTGYVDVEMFTNVGGVWGDTLKVDGGADLLKYSNLKILKK
ncbi:copper amine oxidase N-terminal domain-containing protein [Paenibacillus sp. DYY-L-2]|uniref:copper amine oxidase N-terminal domain-containing protein n=1 Tax=Paenibacillus sp. DYY-L-2 TaxID=3447013 RepID=UPI003F4F9C99